MKNAASLAVSAAGHLTPLQSHLRNVTLDKGGGMSKAIVRSLSFLLVLFSSLTFIWAQEPESKQNQPASDNTKIKQRDRSKSEPTADQQKENRSDHELARKIRRAIVQDTPPTTYAQNIK